MTEFELLDAADAQQRSRWLEHWNAWPEREVAAHPGYVALFAGAHDRVLCATYGSSAAGICFPFLLRPLSAEPWAAPGEACWDITTPYGYGGPYVWGEAGAAAEAFWDAFDQWATANGVVSIFARLSLFSEQLVPFRGEVATVMNNVVRTLDLDEPQLLADYAHKVRKNLKRARSHGLRVQPDVDGRHLDAFLNIYERTMDRRGAASGYYFGRDFFTRIISELPGQYAFFHVWHGEEIVSTELVLLSVAHIYSFLGGTDSAAFAMRPNDLLKHEIIRWGKSAGKRAFVLGGGYGREDGIFKYKLSFAPHGSVPFHIGTRILDQQAHQRLLASREAWEQLQGRAWQPREGYFPSYRS